MKIDLILVQKIFVLIVIAFASAFSLEQLGVRLMSEKTRLDSSTVLSLDAFQYIGFYA